MENTEIGSILRDLVEIISNLDERLKVIETELVERKNRPVLTSRLSQLEHSEKPKPYGGSSPEDIYESENMNKATDYILASWKALKRRGVVA